MAWNWPGDSFYVCADGLGSISYKDSLNNKP